MTKEPDIFTNVHKGIRRALFDTALALGAAPPDVAPLAALRERVKNALRFVEHHGANEDDLLLPLLVDVAPAVHARMRDAHGAIERMLGELDACVDAADVTAGELYLDICAFTARYLDHMHEEERVLEPEIRAALSPEQLAGFGRASVARTPLAEARVMLGSMLPAMPREDALALLAKLPPALQAELRPLVDARA